jgi:hypothetical protein
MKEKITKNEVRWKENMAMWMDTEPEFKWRMVDGVIELFRKCVRMWLDGLLHVWEHWPAADERMLGSPSYWTNGNMREHRCIDRKGIEKVETNYSLTSRAVFIDMTWNVLKALEPVLNNRVFGWTLYLFLVLQITIHTIGPGGVWNTYETFCR